MQFLNHQITNLFTRCIWEDNPTAFSLLKNEKKFQNWAMTRKRYSTKFKERCRHTFHYFRFKFCGSSQVNLYLHLPYSVYNKCGITINGNICPSPVSHPYNTFLLLARFLFACSLAAWYNKNSKEHHASMMHDRWRSQRKKAKRNMKDQSQIKHNET